MNMDGSKAKCDGEEMEEDEIESEQINAR